jgi:putative phosphoesterase
MLELLPQVRNEMGGVRSGEDIEYIHRMRVASRRLRAVIPLFRTCTSERVARRWRTEIRSITRALGEARDADVQIEFLLTFAGGLPRSDRGAQRGFLPVEAENGSYPAEMAIGAQERVRGLVPLRDRVVPVIAPSAARFPGLRALLWRFRIGIRRRREMEAALPTSEEGPQGQQGIECLLLRLQQQREALQPTVLDALDRLERSGVLETMAERLRTTEVRLRSRGTAARTAAVYEAAHLNAALRCDELTRYAQALRDPARVQEHHAMRIAAKRLRYTIEIFASLFEDELRSELKTIKRLQELLGQLHDCDVWIDQLPRFIEEERGRTRAYFGHEGFFRFIEPGIRQLLADRTAARKDLHAACLEFWDRFEYDHGIQRLLGRFAHARDEARLPPTELRAIAEGAGVARIALIADIHANSAALDAVIRDARARGAQAFICAGDVVGDGSHPDEVCRQVIELGVVGVQGEHDRKMVKAIRKREGRRRDATPGGVPASTMLPTHVAYLESLPAERRFTLRGMRFLITHTAPAGEKREIGPGIPDETLARYAYIADAECVIVGHSHRPFLRTAGPVRFINPGSVGRPAARDPVPRAEYAMLQLFPFDLCLLSVAYSESGSDRAAPANRDLDEAAERGG